MVMRACLICLIAGSAAVPVSAQTLTPGVDARQERQAQRIQQGIESSQLTEREAARLNREQDRIRRLDDQAKSDGVVTRGERRALRRAQNRASRHIAKEKHDRQHARSGY